MSKQLRTGQWEEARHEDHLVYFDNLESRLIGESEKLSRLIGKGGTMQDRSNRMVGSPSTKTLEIQTPSLRQHHNTEKITPKHPFPSSVKKQIKNCIPHVPISRHYAYNLMSNKLSPSEKHRQVTQRSGFLPQIKESETKECVQTITRINKKETLKDHFKEQIGRRDKQEHIYTKEVSLNSFSIQSEPKKNKLIYSVPELPQSLKHQKRERKIKGKRKDQFDCKLILKTTIKLKDYQTSPKQVIGIEEKSAMPSESAISKFLDTSNKVNLEASTWQGILAYTQTQALQFYLRSKKISKKICEGDGRVLAQLTRQIKIQSFLDHPNIVQLYSFFCDEDHLYLILELCFSGNLYASLKQYGRYPEEKVKSVLKQVCHAVEYMHDNDVIHRDIKPQNILFHEEIVKVCDFGWSINSPLLRDTRCGTPLYSSPEIVQKTSYDNKIDVWNIGILTYELFYGRVPFQIRSEQDLIKIVDEDIYFSRSIPISAEAKDFITKCLIKNGKDRMAMSQLVDHDFVSISS